MARKCRGFIIENIPDQLSWVQTGHKDLNLNTQNITLLDIIGRSSDNIKGGDPLHDNETVKENCRPQTGILNERYLYPIHHAILYY